MLLRLSRYHCGLAGFESAAAADMAGRSLGRHLLVSSAATRAHEDTTDRTGWSSSERSEMLAAARRAALELREGRVKSRGSGIDTRVGRAGVSVGLGKEQKANETFLSSSGLVLYNPPTMRFIIS